MKRDPRRCLTLFPQMVAASSSFCLMILKHFVTTDLVQYLVCGDFSTVSGE